MTDTNRNCPFYGRHLYPASSKIVDPPFMLIEQRGNQCGAVVSAHAACQMELDGLTVDWRKCCIVAALRVNWREP